jgi:replicative DNA helicase
MPVSKIFSFVCIKNPLQIAINKLYNKYNKSQGGKMDTSFFSVLEATTKVQQSETSEYVVKQNFEESVVLGKVLRDSLAGKALDIDFLSDKHFKNVFYGQVYIFCLREANENGKLRLQDLENVVCGNDPELKSYIRTIMKQSVDLVDEIIKGFAFSLDENLKREHIKKIYNEIAEKLNKEYVPFSDIVKITQEANIEIEKNLYNPFAKKSIYSRREQTDQLEKDTFSSEGARTLTGITSLDNIIGGFGRGEFIIDAGASGMGKTALSIDLQCRFSAQDKNIISFNYEMSYRQCEARFASRDKYIDDNYNALAYKKILFKKDCTYEQLQDVFDVAKKSKNNITAVYNSFTVEQIISFSQRKAQDLMRHGKTLDFVFVDYLQLIPRPDKKDAHLEIGNVTRKLKMLANELNITVIALSQVNRESQKSDNKRPEIHHLRQSGSIEEDADMVLFPFRPSHYEADLAVKNWEESYGEIIIAKNRNAEKGVAKVKALMGYNYFGDGHYDQQDQYAGMTEEGKENIKSKKNHKQLTPENF